MSNIEFNDKEIAYLLLALRKYEEKLLAIEDEEMGDTVTDLLAIQAVKKKIRAAKDGADA